MGPHHRSIDRSSIGLVRLVCAVCVRGLIYRATPKGGHLPSR